MKNVKYAKDVLQIKDFIINARRKIHQNPEIGFDVSNTKEFISNAIKEIGFSPIFFANNGIIVNIKGKSDKVILLRSDIDALPIKEKTKLSYKSKNDFMHACGHDMHAAMLLGALKIIKKYEKRLKNSLKIVFQPAEEVLLGAKNMIENGVLENPKVDAGFMIHVLPFDKNEVGKIILSPSGVCAPSSDFFEIIIKGKESHGAMPHLGIDATLIGAHIILMFEELVSREVGLNEKCVLTIGSFTSGVSNNVISSKAIIKGSIRCLDEKVREKMIRRIKEIVKYGSKTFLGKGKITFTSGAPSLLNDMMLRGKLKDLLDDEFDSYYIDTEQFSLKVGGGSEDFAYFSREIPSFMISINTGYNEPLHNPKIIFDEESLLYGTALFTLIALDFPL